MNIMISKPDGDWTVSYLGDDNIYHYIHHAKTKNQLIIDLARKLHTLEEVNKGEIR